MDEYKKSATKRDYFILLLALADILLGFATLATRNEYISATFSALIFVSGAWMLISIIKSIWVSLESKKWIKVHYQVTETKFRMKMTSGSHSSRFEPFFKIEYEFKGNIYSRSSEDDLNLSVGKVFSTPHAAEKYLESVKKYKYGEFVYVNPAEPHVGYLRTGIGRDQLGILLFSLILISLPLLTYTEIIKWR